MKRPSVVPLPEKRGLNRVEAAGYVGVSPTLFEEMVRDRRMPRPIRINARSVWDRRKLDMAFEALPGDEPVSNAWDAMLKSASVEFIPENGGGAGVRLRKVLESDQGLCDPASIAHDQPSSFLLWSQLGCIQTMLPCTAPIAWAWR